MRQIYISLIGFMCWCTYTQAQNSPIIVSRIQQEVVLDGYVNEAFWDQIEPVPMTVQAPNYGAPLSKPTEIRMAYDDDFLYVSARCFEDSALIMTKSYLRDPDGFDQDWISIQLDTYNDKENGLNFSTFPTGARNDFTVFNDAQPLSQDQSGMPFNASWNTFWNVAVSRDNQGWYAEMRIPFSSLRFQVVDNQAKMGVIITRWLARRAEMQIFPDIPPNWGIWSSWKPSQSREIIFEGIESKKPIYISPYASGGFSQQNNLNEDETAYLRNDDLKYGLGLDLKYGISRNMTMDLTINTDFAQVEADDQQVNLTRFSLFFPEKRQFFLERSSIFDFNFGQNNRLFYSRRIGLEDGEQIPILTGVRLVGRVGKWDMGFMDLQTAKVSSLEQPTENMGVLRFRKNVLNPNSYIGVMTTHRVGMGSLANGNPFNVAYGVDGTIKMFKQDYLIFNWAQSFENGLENDPLSLDPARFRFSWENRNFQGLNYNFTFARMGENYRPGLGFEFRENYTYVGDKIGYGFLPGDQSWLRQHSFSLNPSFYISNESGQLESAFVGVLWEAITKKGAFINVLTNMKKDNLVESFNLSEDVEVPAGNYTYYDANLIFFGSSGKKFLPNGILQAGSYYDGYLLSASFLPIWVLSNQIQLNGFYQYNHANFPDRDQQFNAHVGRLKLLYTPNTKVSLSSFIQYNSAVKSVFANIRFRLNPREGNDFYIVFNEDFNTGRHQFSPVRPVFFGRTILLKYVHTFVL